MSVLGQKAVELGVEGKTQQTEIGLQEGSNVSPGRLLGEVNKQYVNPIRNPVGERLPAGVYPDSFGTIAFWREVIEHLDGEIKSVATVRDYLKLLRQINRRSHPSPASWEDEVLYFLMLDRFSDGRETEFLDNDGRVVRGAGTPRYVPGYSGGIDPRINPKGWLGGTLCGAAEKMGYLRRLGVTAVWVSPVFKQVRGRDTYHGYGIQNFLEVDPHFAPAHLQSPWNQPREALRAFVSEAHRNNIRVILDIVLNHTGDVFAYKPDRFPTGRINERGEPVMHSRFDGRDYEVIGFRDGVGRFLNPDGKTPIFPFGMRHERAWPDGAVWPIELQDPGAFTCKGEISNWDYPPEYIDGDFFDLKNIKTGDGEAFKIDEFRPSSALMALIDVYKFWMAYADIDGYRIDTVKHIERGATRFFAQEIHEFAQVLGKENFYLIGEVTGSRQDAFATVEQTGIDAALGIATIPHLLTAVIRGDTDPQHYFALFRNANELGKDSQAWFNRRVVTMYDDHDMVGREKARLCSHYTITDQRERAAFRALAMNVTSMGIPCIYYGSEQCFNGAAPSGTDDDVYLREAMFGGGFGSLGCGDRHFFNEGGNVYRRISHLLKLRAKLVTLRRGREYLREISGNGVDFGLPTGWGGSVRTIVAWSRIFAKTEVLIAINTDPEHDLEVWATLETGLHKKDDEFVRIFDYDQEEICSPISTLVEEKNGKSVKIGVPKGGFVMYTRGDWIRSACVQSLRIASSSTTPTGKVDS